METNRDSKSYIKYNLDATALLLRNGFPKAHIAVIRPARMEFKTFSCFDNFVRGNNAGVPDHTPMHHSLQHLEKQVAPQNIQTHTYVFHVGNTNTHCCSVYLGSSIPLRSVCSACRRRPPHPVAPHHRRPPRARRQP